MVAVQTLGQLGRAKDLKDLAQDGSVGFLVTQAAEEQLEQMGLQPDFPLLDEPRPLIEHLDELARRLRICTLAWLLGVGISAGLFPILILPLLRALYGAPAGTPLGAALATARWPAALTVGGGVALLVLVYHALRLAWPGLYPWERRQATLYMGIGLLLLVLAPVILAVLSRVNLRGDVPLPAGWRLYFLHRLAWFPTASYLFLLSRWAVRDFRDLLEAQGRALRRWAQWLLKIVPLLAALTLSLLPFWVLSLLIGIVLTISSLFLRVLLGRNVKDRIIPRPPRSLR